ncbi:hypothetical protein Thiowin_00663 [Thiorhodovibrio winogradskyi]|uniref:DUF4214 domain-containing protein n=1 Tax=Thiorhodovibrio winogradskyi TaxID=77007 RepID=A0ABZ0S6G3_9GAMM|nr:DUF4214 domain-containing protein [Thiorhodovibrio winogradskyi]
MTTHDYVNGVNIGDAGESVSSAEPVTLDSNNEATITGHIAGDNDTYRFTSQRSGTVSIELTDLEGLVGSSIPLPSVYLRSYDSNGDYLEKELGIFSYGPYLTYNLNAGETFFVKVDPVDFASTNYNLSIRDADDYVNGVNIGDAGDGISSAELVTLDSNGEASVTGHTIGDDDYYRFTSSGDGTVTIDLSELNLTASGEFYFRLYDSNGIEVVESTSRGESKTITYSVNADETYTVRVDPQGNIASSYNLSIAAPTRSGGSNPGNEIGQSEATNIALLYGAGLGRVPDVGGLNFWIDQHANGMSLGIIAGAFLDSSEFTNRYGDDDIMTSQRFLTVMYDIFWADSPTRRVFLGGKRRWRSKGFLEKRF